MGRFEAVRLPEGAGLNGRASQTLLRHANGCMRSAFFYLRWKGEARTDAMERGNAIHGALEEATRLLVDTGERQVPMEVAKAILEEQLTRFHVPLEEHDYARESVARWASEWEVDPENVVSAERLFVFDVAGMEVRAKVDYAELRNGGRRVYIADYKSARGAPSEGDVSRKRPDGTLMARNFQLVLYALAVAFGVPVRVEEQDGQRVEVRESFGVARTVVDFDMEFVYPGIERSDGTMLRRGVSLTRLELEEYRASLHALLVRLQQAEQSGDWPAVVSDAACSECPAPSECPIPRELRAHRGTINTLEEAAEAAERLDREKADHAARRKELKLFAKARGVQIRYGRDRAARFVTREKVSIPNRSAMFLAMQAALNGGLPFEPDDWQKVSTSTEFVDVTLTDEELAEEAADAGA